MALKDIIRKVAADVGAVNYSTNSEVRARLIELINEAAEELWERNDLPGALREINIRVPSNYIIALPSFIGELRACRDNNLGRPYTINDLRPRYHQHEWPTKWRNWRFIGYSAVKGDITNTAPLTVNIPVADSSLTISITGSTANAAREVDILTMSSTSVVGTKNFTAIESIRASAIADYDISIEDADGNELAVLHNNTLESRYLLVDVSEFPSIGSCTDGTFLMEVLYKVKLSRLEGDNDIFPVPDYDRIVAAKATQLFIERQDGKEARAALLDQKLERTIKRKQQDKEGSVEKKIKFAPNPLMGMFKGSGTSSTRFGGGWR